MSKMLTKSWAYTVIESSDSVRHNMENQCIEQGDSKYSNDAEAEPARESRHEEEGSSGTQGMAGAALSRASCERALGPLSARPVAF